MIIMLDAGHGYSTPGKRSPDGMKEYEFNRAVAEYAKSLLEKHENVLVYFAHSDSEDVPLTKRTNKANRLGADLYVSIHANAHGTGSWNKVGGIETYVYMSKPRSAFQLAEKVQHSLTLATGLKDRGVKTADFHVLRETRMDALLVECGFMTNLNESKLLRTEAFRKACAEAIVNAVTDHHSLTLNQAEPAIHTSKQPNSKTLYKVQAGVFKDRQNAEKLAELLRKAGFDATISIE